MGYLTCKIFLMADRGGIIFKDFPTLQCCFSVELLSSHSRLVSMMTPYVHSSGADPSEICCFRTDAFFANPYSWTVQAPGRTLHTSFQGSTPCSSWVINFGLKKRSPSESHGFLASHPCACSTDCIQVSPVSLGKGHSHMPKCQ